MTHVVREVNKMASKVHKKEIVEPVTIIETPPMVAVGIVGYAETPKGLKVTREVSSCFPRLTARLWWRRR